MKVVLFVAWGGLFAVPIIRKFLSSDCDVVRIYSQGIYRDRLEKYHPSYSLNYKDNVAEYVSKQGYEKYSIITSINSA